MNFRRVLPAAVVLAAAAPALSATEVAICTERGRAVLELADEQAPLNVANFLRYVDMGFYTGTVFHRVVPSFVVQGGVVDRQLRGRTTLPPVANESGNGIGNARGTVAAARGDDPNSATSQFFVNLEDNTTLDAGRDPGYTVFGRVKEGIALFDEIGRLPTGAGGPFRSDVPTPLVAIESIARLDEAALAAWPVEGREEAIRNEIAAAAAAADAAAALRLISHYRALCGPEDVEIALTEARMALAATDRLRALFAAEEVLATTTASDPAYAAAEALRAEVLATVDPAAPETVAGCTPQTAPDLPDGATASRDEMLAAQQQIRAFVAAAETHLACLAAIIDDDERDALERNAAVAEHNRTIGAMEEIAAAFNEQVRIFRDRE